MDRFASSNNVKTKLFNSLYWNPGSLGVNSFNSDWSQDVNWLVPPVTLASRAINHLVKCKAKGTLIVPKWISPPFWPLDFEDGLEYKPYATGDRFTKVIVNRKSKITLKISLRARIRAFH